MPKVEFDAALAPLLASDSRYSRGAYYFVREALVQAQTLLRRTGEATPRHVSPEELLEGIRRHALEEFGPMACTVFEDWGIRSCEDFGEIVFNMIQHRILAKQDSDNREDFKRGYDFKDAFRRPFTPDRRSLGVIR
ncbi:MAG: hypothetical protein KIT22_11540 [Verrucomicrobiae bacterium]|nr:hypothetical protein [Verrucomicrobiae bacterium]